MAAHVRRVNVPDADRRELERRARDKAAPARVVERARIVLLAADGGPGQQIAAVVGCAEGTRGARASRSRRWWAAPRAGWCPGAAATPSAAWPGWRTCRDRASPRRCRRR